MFKRRLDFFHVSQEELPHLKYVVPREFSAEASPSNPSPDFGILCWPSSAFCSGPPRQRMGTLIRAKSEAEETRWTGEPRWSCLPDPSRVRVRRRNDCRSCQEAGSTPSTSSETGPRTNQAASLVVPLCSTPRVWSRLVDGARGTGGLNVPSSESISCSGQSGDTLLRA